MKICLPIPSRSSGNDNTHFQLHSNNSAPLQQEISLESRHSSQERSEIHSSSSMFWKKSSKLLESRYKALRIKKIKNNKLPSPFRSLDTSDSVNAISKEQSCALGSSVDEKMDVKALPSSIAVDSSREGLEMHPLDCILNEAIPKDLLPCILSFAGPQTVAALSMTSKSWRRLVLKECVWKCLSEDYHKWKGGEPAPDSWFDYYRLNPCVPVDFACLESAMNSISNGYESGNKEKKEKIPIQKENVRILLSPGDHVLTEPLIINAMDSITITIETLQKPDQINSRRAHHSSFSSDLSGEFIYGSLNSSPSRSMRRLRLSGSGAILRGICRSNLDDFRNSTTRRSGNLNDLSILYQCKNFANSESRATLILNTSSRNSPVIRVSRGKFQANRINMIHNCDGTDIWNGNAAVQVQPPLDANGRPSSHVSDTERPNGILNEVGISSISGRGAVAIDGGHLVANKCYFIDCAATGIYVGGPGSIVSVQQTDVINNGHGNNTKRRGIGRGHSGVYLEQGTATLLDCNISNNSLTGISAVSNQNACLTIKDSDVKGNGTMQIEMPPVGSPSWNKSESVNNSIAQQGSGRLRSGLNQNYSDEILATVSSSNVDDGHTQAFENLSRNYDSSSNESNSEFI